ncbi:Leucyl aminopeptidase yscIV [Arthrobotrys musiformis]|uniref:Peptide hydrolase n=1 Tax=Arthrobotrys musiformis TaxID=47236 RepID=A0AAV9VP63_9PEZI
MKTSAFVLSALAAAPLVAAAPAAAPLVESNKLRRVLLRSELRARAEELHAIAVRNGGNRYWGTAGHWDTLSWIEAQIDTNYYNVERQYFNITEQTSLGGWVTIDGVAYENVNGMAGSPNKTVTAPIINVKNFGCVASDYPESIAGKIALVARGDCYFAVKNVVAQTAGAIGIVVYNNDDTNFQPGLGYPKDYNATEFIPAAFITKSDGRALVTRLGDGTLPATVKTLTSQTSGISANLIATTKGGDQNQIITVGAHTDSVKAGPGINDNGSGTIAQIEVAKALTKYSVNNAIRFCWWGAEEVGLVGSRYYASHIPEEEAAKIVMNLNFDMLASPNYMFGIYDGDASDFESPYATNGSALIEQTFIDFFKEVGKPSVPTAFSGRSDYQGFLQINIPAGGLFTGAEEIMSAEEAVLFNGKAGVAYDVCYHQACDDVKNLNFDAFITNTKSMADAVAKYGRSIAGFPFPRPAVKLTPRGPLSETMVARPHLGKHSGQGGCSNANVEA